MVDSGELDGLGEGNLGSVVLLALSNPLVTQLEKVMPSDQIYVPQGKNDTTTYTSYSKPMIGFEYVDNDNPSANEAELYLGNQSRYYRSNKRQRYSLTLFDCSRPSDLSFPSGDNSCTRLSSHLNQCNGRKPIDPPQ